MKVSQMIYTACGKERKGDFSTWSKTSDITIEECRCIETVMSYRYKPVDMPYVPTEEDIKKYCPKKYAYFILNSGRKCIAQTNYVSNVYSDLDKRLGNFVIHAFIFDELDDNIMPFDMFNSKQFKDILTYKEWHDDPIPESLPQLDITPFDCQFSDSEIKQAFATYKAGLVPFIQSLLDGVSDENYLVLDAKDEDLPILYHIANLFLSKEQRKQYTLANLFLLANDYSFKMSGVKCIKVRSLYHGDKRPVDFTMPEAQGNLIFSFLSNKFSPVQVSPFLQNLVTVFESLPANEFVKRLEEINTLKDRIHEDGVMTIAVLNFLAKQYQLLDLSFDNYSRLMNIVINNGLQGEKEALLDAYAFGFVSNRWALDQQTLALLKRVYPLLDEQNKAKMMEQLMNNIARFVDPSLDPENYLTRFKEVIFSYEDFVKGFIVKPFQVGAYQENYFALGALIYAISKNMGEKSVLWTNVRALFMASLRRHEINEVRALLRYVEGQTSNAFNKDWAYKYVYLYSLEAKNKEGRDISLYNETSDNATLSFGFEILDLVDESQKEEYLFKFINKAYKNPRFIDLYLSKRKFNNVFNAVETTNERFFFDNIYKRFIPAALSENSVNDAFAHIDDVLENLRLEYLELLINSVYRMRGFAIIYIAQKERRNALFAQYEEKYGEWIYNNLYLPLIPENGGVSREEIEAIFKVASSLEENARAKYLTHAFAKLNANGIFLAYYIKEAKKDQPFYSHLELELKKAYPAEFEQFAKRKSSSVFEEQANVDDRALEIYFNEHYKKGEDAGAYIKQLDKYLTRLLVERKDRFIQYVFERLLPSFNGVEDNFQDMMDIYALIENKIYSLDMNFLIDRFDTINRRNEVLTKLNEKLLANNKPTSGKYEVIRFLYKVKFLKVLEDVRDNSLYNGLNEKQLAFVFDEALDLLLKCYFEMRRRTTEPLKMFEVFFKAPYEKCKVLDNLLRVYLETNFRERLGNYFFVDLIVYALASEENDLQRFSKNFVDKYLEDMADDRLAKRAIEEAVSRAGGRKDPKGEKVNRYLEEFNANHKRGFFGFGKRK